jgi:hypothetical protein
MERTDFLLTMRLCLAFPPRSEAIYYCISEAPNLKSRSGPSGFFVHRITAGTITNLNLLIRLDT